MNKTIELFEMAAQNSDFLREEFLRIKENKSKDEADLLDDFCKKLDDGWNISANVSDFALADWLNKGCFKNVYDMKEEQADELIKIELVDPADKDSEKEAAIKAHLGTFFERRTIFDSTFQDGKKLKYLALNIGGSGIDKYGHYCVIIDKDKVRNYSSLAFIKMDSALNYVKDGQVEIDQLKYDLANEECMPKLAAIKHESHPDLNESGKWELMLCGNEDYVEAVTIDNILNDHIASVRIKKALYNEIYIDMLMKVFKNEKISRYERYRLNFFKDILADLKKRNINPEIVNEN